MRKESINDDLKLLAFEFFYWFSRFEFSLKENKILKSEDIGANAEPGWDQFVKRFKGKFEHSAETQKLLDLNPKRQRVSANSTIEWKSVGLSDCSSDLCKTVRLVKTIRNNLFHGGKHGAEGWDDPIRTTELLSTGKAVLDQLARLGGIEGDYAQCY
ncbi:hypothetical protein [Microbulbifer celer]|uniref:Apea-like HEPN domain-containing protein n=1 Tax=Microbulbifer celer TaxID=435905 RepID=A0ABW3U3M8_9GAMM|nr:hypothetical protein [Microbulbifer celer]UFN56039.1 hypothetical protein LPW13_10665 [Microbulbifer celer]UFN58212.1 hypothetical protein LPW13_03980 [Microbulbifer celer]